MDHQINRDFYLIDDFVWDEDFRLWVLHNTPERDEYWKAWLSRHPEKREDIMTARDIVNAVSIKEVEVSDEELELSIQNILLQIEDDKPAEQVSAPAPPVQKQGWIKYAAIAAVVLVVLSVTSVFYLRSNALPTYTELVKTSANTLQEQANNNAKSRIVQLADGSRITLWKNARISYAPDFNNYSTRKVYLYGKATFEVAKNPQKPFFVYSSGLVTKVLGTRFTITSNEAAKNATVEVISGVVSVSSMADKKPADETTGKKQNSLVLTRNQKASFSREERTLVAAIVDQPVALSNTDFEETFTDAPLKDVFKKLEDSYGINIIYDEKNLAAHKFTANLANTSMYDKLDIICKIVNARYEVIDGKIVISANNTSR